jgi:hypothetical protein
MRRWMEETAGEMPDVHRIAGLAVEAAHAAEELMGEVVEVGVVAEAGAVAAAADAEGISSFSSHRK